MATRQKYDDCPYTGDHACAVEAFLDVLGGRWKGMILFHLLPGTRRFGELKKLLPHVTQRMLTNQLRELEKDGVVSRKVYAEVPPRVEYTLTELGESLRAPIIALGNWAQANWKQIEAARERYDGSGVSEEAST